MYKVLYHTLSKKYTTSIKTGIIHPLLPAPHSYSTSNFNPTPTSVSGSVFIISCFAEKDTQWQGYSIPFV